MSDYITYSSENKNIEYFLTSRWWKDLFLFSLSMIFPSIAIFKKLGIPFLALYLFISSSFLYALVAWIIPVISLHLNKKKSILITIVLFLLIGGAYIIIHPIINTAGFTLFSIKFGAGDSDNAIDVALNALLNGKYPYYEQTFLHRPLTPMSGSLLMATPFYLLGDSALQNVFWYALFWVSLWKHNNDIITATILIIVVSILSPNVIYHICQGSDYIANSIFVLIAILTLLKSVSGDAWRQLGATVFTGITIASRLNWILLLPIPFFYVAAHSNYRTASKVIALALTSFAILVLPFYLYDPQHFSPLHVRNELTIRGTFPYADILVATIGGIIAIVLGMYRGHEFIDAQMKNCFLIQAFIIISGFILAAFAAREINLYYPHYGIFFLFFGVFAYGPKLIRDSLERGTKKLKHS